MKTPTKKPLNIISWNSCGFSGGLLTILFTLFIAGFAYAGPPIHSGKKIIPIPTPLSGCTAPAAQADLDINNVRARFLTSGDMWWDYSDNTHGRYEVPYNKNETTAGPMPIYAGALWVGGINSGNLYLAGQRYRDYGYDWWPGPLDTIGGSATISPDVCVQYDQHYKITQAEVSAFANGTGPQTAAITNWPGNGDKAKGQAQYLAPFFDANGDGKYNPADKDYPGFDLVQGDNFGGCQINNCVPFDQLFGDECLWWVINDKGNIHTQSNGLPMGLEVHCQAFGFNTDDEINSMTFINYRMYNRSSLELDSAFMAQWCDPDLGCATDDHVGCDVTRGVGYVYNETNDDIACSGELGYGVSPPSLGIDFFRGPIATPGDGVDNNHNCVVDEPCEQCMMTHFTYFTNGAPQGYSDPIVAKEYYNYMSGSWANGDPVYYGGAGYPPTSTTTLAAYCYPGNSDPIGWGIGGNCTNHVAAPVPNWGDPIPGNPGQDDRRFVESAGPFKLLPGAVNVVTIGVVWARSTGGNMASVNLMLAADDKAQKLFDNCFQVLNGPDAPDLTIQELNNKLIIYLTNKPASNNYKENYREYDPSISLTDSAGNALHCIDTTYHFEGYRIFQLKDGTVSAGDLYNSDGSINTAKAQQIAECDVKNGISTVVNYVFNQDIGASVPTTEIQGADNGIFHSLVVTTDAFNGTPLVNHKTYYFMATSYAYNNYKPYKQDVTPVLSDNVCGNFPNGIPASTITSAYDGQKKPYKQGRRNIQSYAAIPHISNPYIGGTSMEGSYGSGPMITRIEGNGNGGMVLDFTSATTSAILAAANSRYATPTYQNGKGPINVTVVDPLNVPDGQSFTLKFDSTNIVNSTWTLTNNTTSDVIHSDKTIQLVNEQLLLQYGLAIAIVQPTDPGSQKAPNGFLEATMTGGSWLTGLADVDGASNANWIRSGTATSPPDYVGIDDDKVYQGLIVPSGATGGTWAPYALTAYSVSPFAPATNYYSGPRYDDGNYTLTKMKDIASVDVVFTSDQSKWTRCVVLEMCEDSTYEGASQASGISTKARKLDLRRAPSVDKNGQPDGTGYGMGWFPGYALNLETGERLNIAFGENSALINENGNDMKWNPTANVTESTYHVPWDSATQTTYDSPVYGGEHYIYVFGHNAKHTSPSDAYNVPAYDSGKFLDSILSLSGGVPSNPAKRGIFRDAMWVSIPMVAPGHNLLESDVTVRLRVGKTYKPGYSTTTDTASAADISANGYNKNLPMYTFSTAGIATVNEQNSVAVSALDLINVVPNPYYAYSDYETSNLDNRIKITNLPEQCTVSIYNLGGTLVRRLVNGEPILNTDLQPKSSSSSTTWSDGSLDWDLKNTAGTPISSGVYIIHVEVPGVGEKVVKWFGIMRPVDLGSF